MKEREHWVATSYHVEEVRLYDSCSTGKLTPSLAEQIAQVYRPAIKDGQLKVTMMPVQQQVGFVDCGLYSIAASYNAAQGQNLRAVTYTMILRKCVHTCKSVLRKRS